jgi:hypothetical protein
MASATLRDRPEGGSGFTDREAPLNKKPADLGGNRRESLREKRHKEVRAGCSDDY